MRTRFLWEVYEAVDEDEVIKLATKLMAERRWKQTPLKERLLKGQQLKMARITKHGYLLCSICDQAMTRDAQGEYIHVKRLRDKDHKASP